MSTINARLAALEQRLHAAPPANTQADMPAEWWATIETTYREYAAQRDANLTDAERAERAERYARNVSGYLATMGGPR